jgi:hypothetical protein
MWIANVHQATSERHDLQQRVWTALAAIIDQRKGWRGILGGDLNASPPGTRKYYRPSNKASIEKSDSLLQTFLQSTGGKLMQTQAATRVDPVWGNEAKLDNLVLWNIDGHKDLGQAQWIGSATQDHARACFELDQSILGRAQPHGDSEKDNAGPDRVASIMQMEDEINHRCNPMDKAALEQLRQQQLDPSTALRECLERRQSAAWDISREHKTMGSRGAQPKRLPKRSKAQVEIYRNLATIKAAQEAPSNRANLTAAETKCLDMLGLQEQLAGHNWEEMKLVVQSNEWRQLLQEKVEQENTTLARISKKQTHEARLRADREARREFTQEQGGIKRFTGKIQPQPAREQLNWSAVVGCLTVSTPETEPTLESDITMVDASTGEETGGKPMTKCTRWSSSSTGGQIAMVHIKEGKSNRKQLQ